MAGGRDTGGGGGGDDLAYEAETLTAFRGRIDEILRQLEKSPASHRTISDQTVVPDAYGTGFSAAEDLSARYDRIHARLRSLSRLFGEQLEALGIATQIVDRGYEGVEADQRERFQAIRTRVDEYRQGRQEDPETGKDSESDGTKKSVDADTDFD